MKFDWILLTLPADKANHACYGAVIFLVAAALAIAAGQQSRAANAALFASAAVGVAKELADWLANRRAARAGLAKTSGVEGLDALATSCGGLVCWIAMGLGAP